MILTSADVIEFVKNWRQNNSLPDEIKLKDNLDTNRKKR